MQNVTNNGSRNRQAEYRRRMELAGFVQVTGWVYRHQAASVKTLIHRLQEEADCEAGPLRNSATGRLARLER